MTIQQLSGDLSKGRDGWQARSDYQVPDRKERLRISTYKSQRGGLQTIASCYRRTADGQGETFVMFQDYMETITADRAARCTEKPIKTLHAQAEAVVADIMARAVAHYAALDAKGGVAPD